MANIKVDYKVRMTCWHGLPDTGSIGTIGLGPCLGLIVHKGGQVYCGHMACAIGLGVPDQKANNLNRIRTAARGALLETGVTKPVDGIAFASKMPDETTKAIYAVAKEYFETNQEMKKMYGIYWKDGTVQYAADNDSMTGKLTDPGPESEYEMDDKFQVK